jgi:hypothetical protein
MLAEASIIYMDVVYAGNAGAISSASQKIMSFRAQREICRRRPGPSPMLRTGSVMDLIFSLFLTILFCLMTTYFSLKTNSSGTNLNSRRLA